MIVSNRSGAILRLSLALALAVCALWPGIPVSRSKTSASANPPPDLRGTDAVEHLKFAIKAADSGGGVGATAFTGRIVAGGFVTVSAASFTSPVAPKEVVAGFGSKLSDTTASASLLPPPTSLDGASVIVKDSAGVERPAPLFFISPAQINYQIPAGVALGEATVSVFDGLELVATGAAKIVTTAPSIFAVNRRGFGPAAALDALTFAPAPFSATLTDGSPNFIAVWGTGLGADATDGGGDVSASVQALINRAPVTVTYAGPAPGFQGGNQFNIRLPAGITSGEHTLTFSRGGAASNAVTITIRHH